MIRPARWRNSGSSDRSSLLHGTAIGSEVSGTSIRTIRLRGLSVAEPADADLVQRLLDDAAASTYGRMLIGDKAIAVSGRPMAAGTIGRASPAGGSAPVPPGSKSWSAVHPRHIFSSTRQ
ncbi:hypothetical protein Airi01_029130 [Actinoallomurus iriomotensis]|uniref:Uncharacterized protein n=1 Tax=Actinoallomurus iriomotensis TaxID=478107 RepID=A0A9W6VQI0_9ACTN|nr:hypothetical protein Airi01_029130 [Actinoallomurus iriomotensis]